jgi:DNA repair protein RecN (Recombination protein N)
MLVRLSICDFVLVDRLDLEFAAGFGALTGETGAGKSILVDALAFALGERADVGLIRAGRERTEVAACFDLRALPAVHDWLLGNDFADDEELLLRRVLDAGGRSRAYINGSAATLAQVRELAEALVDIHGQHAHQSLLRADAQRALLDGHAGLTSAAREVNDAWRAWREAKNALDAAAHDGAALAEERERLEWQVREVDALAFSADEWPTINGEHKRLAHAASLVEGAQFALGVLADDEGACESQVDSVAHKLDALAEYDPQIAEIGALVASASAELSEAVSALRRYADRADLDPERFAEVERRLEAIVSCARKYRVAPEVLPESLAIWKAKLEVLGSAGDVAALTERVEEARRSYESRAGKLSVARKKAAKTLGDEVSRVMQELALGGGRFEVALLPLEGGAAHGLEQIEFRVGGLAAAEARSLAKVASGGELSRISLAIQVVTSQAAQVPTLIFDEVDVGIGGGVAEVVGRLLARLGAGRQVLCVTHLPQVAARADWQWQVAKARVASEVTSRITPLDAQGRVEEIARMLGGVEITPTTREHARELLGLVSPA